MLSSEKMLLFFKSLTLNFISRSSKATITNSIIVLIQMLLVTMFIAFEK